MVDILQPSVFSLNTYKETIIMEANDLRRTVLIVDDTPENISILNAALMEDYTIKVATRGGRRPSRSP